MLKDQLTTHADKYLKTWLYEISKICSEITQATRT